VPLLLLVLVLVLQASLAAGRVMEDFSRNAVVDGLMAAIAVVPTADVASSLLFSLLEPAMARLDRSAFPPAGAVAAATAASEFGALAALSKSLGFTMALVGYGGPPVCAVVPELFALCVASTVRVSEAVVAAAAADVECMRSIVLFYQEAVQVLEAGVASSMDGILRIVIPLYQSRWWVAVVVSLLLLLLLLLLFICSCCCCVVALICRGRRSDL
jgi:hypothetical protein